MDLRQLGYVTAIVDEGGFTKAAAALQVAQPSLSQAVRSLEAELGVELFHRTARPVTLTAAGEALIGPARQALRDAATARAAVAEVVGLAAGHLDLVSLPTLAVRPASMLIGRFRRAHPLVSVRLVEPEHADAVAERVRNGSSEIGFAELPLAGADLESHPLEVQEFVALVPAGLEPDRDRGGALSIRTLARQALVTTPPGTSTRRQIDEAFASVGLAADVAVETDHREAIGPLVRAGAGIAILPRALAEDAATADVVIREVRPKIGRQVGLIHRRGPLSPAAHSFRALAVRNASGGARPRPRRR
jgi:LysR family carnitine catabolism transcriptional activator